MSELKSSFELQILLF